MTYFSGALASNYRGWPQRNRHYQIPITPFS